MLATEYVVGKVGGLIDAPVCEVALAEIPPEIEGWEFRNGHHLTQGIGNASLAVPDANELHELMHRDEDENAWRHAGVFALYDWCWGGDEQWLYCSTEEQRMYSHDHGWYLPEVGESWSEGTLLARIHEPHEYSASTSGIPPKAFEGYAQRLTSVRREDLSSVLSSVPEEWSIPTSDLEALGYFLEERAPAVARRLEGRTQGGGSTQ